MEKKVYNTDGKAKYKNTEEEKNRYTVKNTSEYFNTVHSVWLQVPKHWIGEDSRNLSDTISI